jgi:transcription elongation factor GreA
MGSSRVILTFADDGVVRIGSRVRVRDRDGEEEFSVVPPEEADPVDDRLSSDSPLGHALLGRHVGERVLFRAPGGIMSVTLVDIG